MGMLKRSDMRCHTLVSTNINHHVSNERFKYITGSTFQKTLEIEEGSLEVNFGENLFNL